LPNAFSGPALDALAQRVVLAKTGWQRPPGVAVARHSKHGVEKEPVIDAGSADVAGMPLFLGFSQPELLGVS
jgi:hypothetical protein